MKIAIITSGLLPMPSVKDGAIETLLQYVIDYNEYYNNNINFDIYSIYDNNARKESTKYKNSKFIYVKNNKIMKKISDFVFKFFRNIQLYPDPNFEFQFIKNVFKLIKKINMTILLLRVKIILLIMLLGEPKSLLYYICIIIN